MNQAELDGIVIPDPSAAEALFMVELRDVAVRYAAADGHAVQAVDGVSLQVRQGEIFGIIGRSGAGKSTLVRTLNLLARPQRGEIIIGGQALQSLNPEALRKARREIGMIFQHFNLLSSRTAAENIALPLELAGHDKAHIRQEVARLLDLVGLSAQAGYYPHQLSGGQKQRVGIARALANRPRILLSDEATSALDPETTRNILELLREINQRLGLTILLITHEMQVIKQICSRVAVMDGGRIVETGPVIDVFQQAQHPTTRALISDVVAHDLPASVLARAQSCQADAGQEGSEKHLVRLSFVGEGVEKPILSDVSRRLGVDFHFMHGQIDEIQGKAIGNFTLVAFSPAQAWRETVALFNKNGIRIEDLSHVL